MSVEILYGRQFVDLKDGRILPVVLSGSSNCTEYINGREVYERHWWIFGNDKYLTAPISELVDEFKKIVSDGNSHEFMRQGSRGGKWLDETNFVRWIETGIKKALTIEEIRFYLPHQALKMSIIIHYEEDGHFRFKETNIKYCESTEEITEWIDSYKAFVPTEANAEKYASTEFYGRKSLGIKKVSKATEEKPMICRVKKMGYLMDVGPCGFTCNHNPKDAMIFNTRSEFEEVLRKSSSLQRWGFALVSADVKEKKQGEYVLKITGRYRNGLYIQRKTRNGCKLAYKATYAKHFTSESAAKKWADEFILNRGFDFEGIEVEKDTEAA